MDISLKTSGMLIVLSSPSGGGKSSICRALLAADTNLEYSVSVTSRPPRGNEVTGVDYHFVSEDEFHEHISENAFYEWAKVHDNFYGTRRDIVDERLARGKDVVLDIDVVGGLNIKKAQPNSLLIFVLPPSFEILEQRLRGRQTDSEEQIQKRLKNARYELNFANKYDYIVRNEVLDETIRIIQSIIKAERHSARHLEVILAPRNPSSVVEIGAQP